MTPFYEQPILNSPYFPPTLHHALGDDGRPLEQKPFEGRRKSRYIVPVPNSRRRGPGSQSELELDSEDAQGRYSDNAVINQIEPTWMAGAPCPIPTIGALLDQGLGEAEQARFGEPALVTPRLGQGAFRITITELYARQCALTEGKVLPALDAAHIRPYAEGGTHTKSNGILLRKDIHSVFDAGYATFDPDFRFVVSDKVRDVFKNGNEYRRLHGTRLRLPEKVGDRPDAEALRWHNDYRFLG